MGKRNDKTSLHWEQESESEFTCQKLVDGTTFDLSYHWDGDDQNFAILIGCGIELPCIHQDDLHIGHFENYNTIETADNFEDIEPKALQAIYKINKYLSVNKIGGEDI